MDKSRWSVNSSDCEGCECTGCDVRNQEHKECLGCKLCREHGTYSPIKKCNWQRNDDSEKNTIFIATTDGHSDRVPDFGKVFPLSDGFMPFTSIADETIQEDAEEHSWWKRDMSFSIPIEYNAEMLGLFDTIGAISGIRKLIDRISEVSLSVDEFVEEMKLLTFGDKTNVAYYPHGVETKPIIAVGRGSGKTHPVVCDTNVGTFVFTPTFDLHEVTVDDIGDEFFALAETLELDETGMRKRIKQLQQMVKYEKHPLRKKQLLHELDELKREVKHYGKKKPKV